MKQRSGDMPSRRSVLRKAGVGFGAMSLAAMFGDRSLATPTDPLAPKPPHFPALVKRVIFLFMHGGPSHLDTFDPKARLDTDHGKPMPIKRELTFAKDNVGGLMRSPFTFKQYGQSGIPVSSLFPHVAECADDLCVIRSMVGDGVDHGGAILQLNTGTINFTRPSMGSWILYGLGTENRDLPAFVTIMPSSGHGGVRNWSSAFLPGCYQGTPIGNAGQPLEPIRKAPIENLIQERLTGDQQRYELEMLRKMNQQHFAAHEDVPALEARIQSFELAFRMQMQAPEAFDVEKETDTTKQLYGLDNPVTQEFGWQCLLARRMVERGVRFAQCWHSYKWDQHNKLAPLHTKNALEVDKPIAGLLKDLKQRGLLRDTLVIWGGEFGRTPFAQIDGRDHNPYGYSMWLAGAGVKPGFIYGATDDFGYHAVQNRMHIHDFHATLLHLMGLDHTRLTYRFGGRDFRLTDVAGVVADGIIQR